MTRVRFPHLLLASTLLLSGVAMAQDTATPPQPGADTPHAGHKREKKQQARIHEGVDKGQLTPQEAKRLKREQRVIDRQQDKAKADGVVTEKEHKRINRMQDAASKDIARQRSDAASGPAR